MIIILLLMIMITWFLFDIFINIIILWIIITFCIPCHYPFHHIMLYSFSSFSSEHVVFVFIIAYTTTQGLPDDLDMLKISKALKKTLNCNGCTGIDPDYGEILQLSGRAYMMTFAVLYSMWFIKWYMIVYCIMMMMIL